jgi:hypothetical protein
MNPLSKPGHRSNKAAALLIVLAFVVIATGLGLAYLSRATSDRQVAHGSHNQSKADQLAESGVDTSIGDLRQEIVNGSASPAPTFTPASSPSPTPDPFYLYIPTNNAYMVPVRNGTPGAGATPIPNLIRRSVRSDSIPSPGVGSRASAVNSTTDVSANGRSISTARWNSHYLIPRANTGITIDSTPVSSFVAPDWVLVTRAGPAAFASWNSTLADASINNNSYAIGRYAYAVYDEGGLLDVNVAGYPTNTTVTQSGRKGAIAYADLAPTPGVNVPQAQVDNIVGWRNYASTQPGGSFASFTFTTAQAQNYFNLIASETTGFLTVPTTTWSGRTDQSFLSRQQLLDFRAATGFTQNALQYLGTFSRELNSPTFSPATPTATNPDFRYVRVTTAFTRNDGTQAIVGEPFIERRFLLQRLNWLTYRGPSASRTIPSSQPSSQTDPDYDMWLLTGRFGLAASFLQQGTAGNILKYLGLVWDSTNERWNYTSPSGGSLASSIATLGTLTGTREPDFFELLQAGILNSSLGDSLASNPALPIIHQQSKMLHILTIGANLIAQARADSYPVRIAFSNAGTTMEAVGSPRLPYINSLAACPIGIMADAGGVHWFLVPNLWDPFRDSWDLTEANVSGITLTPAYRRPPVRITVTGSAGSATVGFAGATVSQTGSVPGSFTPFPGATLSGINSSLTLTTGTTSGRDGLLEASPPVSSDITPTPTPYNPATAPSLSWEWDSISTTAPLVVALRLSLPATLIPSAAVGQNPILILNSGFQVKMDYQSPNGQWYPYSFLQGNSATSTWISANLNLGTTFSTYGVRRSPPGTNRTILNGNSVTTWSTATLATAPMFAKADPRSIRYNSQIGVVTVPTGSAGILGSIWPTSSPSPPQMAPTPNPAIYSQTIGDNGLAGSNPYISGITGDRVRPVMMNRPFRSVGEMGYAFRDQPFKTTGFSSANSPDAALLDLFCVNESTDTSGMRAGVINLNTRQTGDITAALNGTIEHEDTGRVMVSGSPSPAPSPVIATTPANNIATSLVSLTSTTPILNKASLADFTASQTELGSSVPKTERESIVRALGESGQPRAWNLMIDVIAQSGRYPPGSSNLAKFVVEGEQRYWVHVAIDRFTGQVLDKQIEVVNE